MTKPHSSHVFVFAPLKDDEVMMLADGDDVAKQLAVSSEGK